MRPDARTDQFGNTKHDAHGTAVTAALLGATGSSTRSEFYCTIIATCHKGALHLGIDNSTCLRTLQQLINLAHHIRTNANLESVAVRRLQKKNCTGYLKRPWKLQKHGDLILMLLRCIIAR